MPVLFALFLQTMYGTVDLLVVGQFGIAADVSAVSTGSQLMQAVTVTITGLAMGMTVFVGRKIGAGLRQEAGKIIGSGIWMFGLIAVVLTMIMVFAASLLAQVMHAPEEAFEQTVSYITICSAGAVFIVAYNLVGSIFRGIGDSKMPLVTVAIACALNIAGDLILVAGFHMGDAGAAIATVFAQAVSVLLSLLIIQRRELPFNFSFKDVRPQGAYIKEIFKLGTPIALQDLLVNTSFLVIAAIVNGLGLNASAGVGVAEKMCGFLMLLPSAYMQSMSAFVAQNMGGKETETGEKSTALQYCIFFRCEHHNGIFYFFHGDLLAGIFAKDTEIIMAATDYLRAYAFDCLLTPFLFSFIGYFNGCSCTTFVMLQGLIGAFGVRIPISWLMSRQAAPSLFRIGLATPASTVVHITLCGIYFYVMLRKEKQNSRTEINGIG